MAGSANAGADLLIDRYENEWSVAVDEVIKVTEKEFKKFKKFMDGLTYTSDKIAFEKKMLGLAENRYLRATKAKKFLNNLTADLIDQAVEVCDEESIKEET